MLNLLSDFRKKSNSSLWRVLLLLWTISSINLFLSPAFTISDKDQLGHPSIHSANSTETYWLNELIHFIFTEVNPNADLADTVEDSADKIEFISAGYCILKPDANGEERRMILLHETLLNTILEKSTPPPKIG
jgi:hypothetical protein